MAGTSGARIDDGPLIIFDDKAIDALSMCQMHQWEVPMALDHVMFP
jgi:hypothetical protein